MSVRTPEGFVRNSTLAGCRCEKTHCIGITHHPKPEASCSSGRNEEKKKDNSVLRKEGNVYVLDVFVKVPSGAIVPIKYKPMEVGAIDRVADGREQGKQVTF